MQHITQSSGLSVQAPNPSAMIRTTITARAAAKKAQQNTARLFKTHSQNVTLYT